LLLVDAGLPASVINIDNVTRWMAAENPPTEWWNHENPLNVNASGLGYDTFPDLTVAASKTAQVLRQGNMGRIYDVLFVSGSLANFSAACAYAPWSTGGYHDLPNYIASIPQPAAWTAPGTGPAPTPPPAPPPPAPPVPILKEDDMLASTPSGNGYWICKPDGSVWSYGDAQYLGGCNPGAAAPFPPGETAISITAHPTTPGYWILSNTYAVYAFGQSGYHGAP
jgi:hypothetical protein